MFRKVGISAIEDDKFGVGSTARFGDKKFVFVCVQKTNGDYLVVPLDVETFSYVSGGGYVKDPNHFSEFETRHLLADAGYSMSECELDPVGVKRKLS